MAKQSSSLITPSLRIRIVIAACLWWLILASLSRIKMSHLQIYWGFDASVAIFFFYPLCILSGLFGLLKFHKEDFACSPLNKPNSFINCAFAFFLFLFVLQFLWQLPPILSDDPSNARLTWGFRYIHVATEITIRTALLLCLGRVAVRRTFLFTDFLIIVPAVIYAFFVVSRGLILEFFIYCLVTSILIRITNSSKKLALSPKHIAFLFAGLAFFILYGEWRQGTGFSISEYGQMLFENSSLAWLFGYFLVNFDNLAMIITDNFHNKSVSNVFGPLLQTLQCFKYEDVDDYLYVGRFNLGTAFRPFFLDYGVWLGGLCFLAFWLFWIRGVSLCVFNKNKTALTLLLIYAAFCLPITSRVEQPPYLLPFLIILFLDKLEYFTLPAIDRGCHVSN